MIIIIEEQIVVVGVMFFTCVDPKIVVKSLFPVLYLKNQKPHIFTPPLPGAWRSRRCENMGFLVVLDILHHEHMVYHNFLGLCHR